MRADRRYTNGLMERLERSIPNTPGRVWHLEHGSATYGRWWRVCERGDAGELYNDIAAGATEYDMQRALAAFLDGYARANTDAAAPDMLQSMKTALEMLIDSWGEEQIAAGDDQVANVLRAAIDKAEGR